MSKANVSVSAGPPLFLLFLTFLILKLTKVISWSWWWITSPLWIPAAFIMGIFTFVGIFLLVVLLVEHKK